MAYGAAASIEEPAFHARNQRVLATFAVQALRTLARSARGTGRWRRPPAKGVEVAGSGLTGRLLSVAVQRLPVVADTGEHGADGRVLKEGPYGNGISGLSPA